MLIDFHAHAFLDKLAANAVSSLAARAHFTPFCDGTVDGTARLMREQGVDRFAVLNIAVSPKTERHVNDFAISLLDRGDTVLPFGSVHPSSPDAFSELERLKNAGIRGIKFHNEYQNFFVDDESAFPVYERCAELGFIMLFHGGADRGFSPPVKTAPRRMRRVALRFPQAKIIVAHLGGQDMQQEAIDELADTNVYIDTSFVSRSVEPSVAERSIRAFGFDRVIFGSDCPWDTPANTVAFLQAMGFSPEEYEKIYSKNALKILGE